MECKEKWLRNIGNDQVLLPIVVRFQPAEDVFPESMMSFELYGSLDNAMAAHPNIPKEKWDKYDFSGDAEPIEDPTFID